MATNHVFTVAGSKGGVGKTTTSINLGACFAAAGHATAVVEVDLPMANLVDFVNLDIDAAEAVTLHDVLAGDASVGEAVYDIRDRLSVVPSGTDLEGYTRSDIDRLEPALQQLRWHFDIIIMDTPAGMSEAVVKPIELADEALLISTPRVSSVRNVRNTKQVSERAGTDIGGLILSKSGTGASPGADRIADFIGLDLLGHVPEDDAVPHSQDQGEPVVEYAPNSGAAIAYRKIADALLGTDEDIDTTGTGGTEYDTDPVVADEAAEVPLGPESTTTPASGPVATSDGGRTAEAGSFIRSASGASGGGDTPESDATGEPGTAAQSPSPSEKDEDGDAKAGATVDDTTDVGAADTPATTDAADEGGTEDSTVEAATADGTAVTDRSAMTNGAEEPDRVETPAEADAAEGTDDAGEPGVDPGTDDTDKERSVETEPADDSVPESRTQATEAPDRTESGTAESKAEPQSGSESRTEPEPSPGESGRTGESGRDEPEVAGIRSGTDADAEAARTADEGPADEERTARGTDGDSEDEEAGGPGNASLGARIRSALGL